jgi:hypothetical protein
MPISPRGFLVSRFAAKIWPAFRGLWRKSAMPDERSQEASRRLQRSYPLGATLLHGLEDAGSSSGESYAARRGLSRRRCAIAQTQMFHSYNILIFLHISRFIL